MGENNEWWWDIIQVIINNEYADRRADRASKDAKNAPKPKLTWQEPPEKYGIYNDLALAQNEALWKQREAFGGLFSNTIFPSMATGFNNIGKGWAPQSDYGKKAFGNTTSADELRRQIDPDAMKGDWYKIPQSVKDAYAKYDKTSEPDPTRPNGGGGGGPAGGGGGGFGRNRDYPVDDSASGRYARETGGQGIGSVSGAGDPYTGWSGDYDRGNSRFNENANKTRESFMTYNRLMDTNLFDRQVRPDGSILFIDKKTGKGVMMPGNEWSQMLSGLAKVNNWSMEDVAKLLHSPHKFQQYITETEDGKSTFNKIMKWATEHGEELGAIGIGVYTGNPIGIAMALLKIGWDWWKEHNSGNEGGN